MVRRVKASRDSFDIYVVWKEMPDGRSDTDGRLQNYGVEFKVSERGVRGRPMRSPERCIGAMFIRHAFAPAQSVSGGRRLGTDEDRLTAEPIQFAELRASLEPS